MVDPAGVAFGSRVDRYRGDTLSESLPLILAALPLGLYEMYALKTRRVPTITEAVRRSPLAVKIPLGAGLATLFSHLFIGKP